MSPDNLPTLSYDTLREAVGRDSAFRLRLRLEPAGGAGDKVFPPTYEGGQYATEERWIAGQKVPCVLLDSVQSQANRMEFALQQAWEAKQIALPVVSADFRDLDHPAIRKVTSLQAPHRIADAILRDSLLDGVPFRQSWVGQKLERMGLHNATPLFEHCPTALIFGLWDSTGPRGGAGVKFPRAVVSEIVGVNAVAGVTTSSRIDPLGIRAGAGPLYQRVGSGWTSDEEKAAKDGKGKPVKLGKDGKPSEANHGNVTPDLVYRRDRNRNLVLDDQRRPIPIGGFTVDYAEQVTVLSLPALRRLHFPLAADPPTNRDVDLAARAYLAALGLLGATLAADEGYDLRSRCVLRATESMRWERLGKPGEQPQGFGLTADQGGIELVKMALKACEEAGLPFHREEIPLTPSADLLTLVKRSLALAAQEGEAD
jgi:CRISPR-associated protein Csb1